MRVTEIKGIDYVDCTPENPMQLFWLNPLPGFDTWVFSRRQEFTLSTSDKDIFEPIINYLQLANGIQTPLGKEAFMSIKLGYEGLNRQQVIGISYLFTSQLVYVMQGINQVVVSVREGSYKLYDTGESKHKIEFEIVLPRLYTVSL